MKRAGFTMIELIFVIVILGILGAVAIPKLSGIKDDAQLANANENICVNLKGSLMSYSVRRGTLEDFNLSKYASLDAWGDPTPTIVLKSGNGAGNGELNDVNASTLTAALSNTSNNVHIYFIDGNDSVGYSCLVGNSATSATTADEARAIIAKGSNYL
ncbi:MAG: type II secretion system protein [Epsilonproteobacteria bacterium]|nr:type II secretion system protein [Campylobacterota bacterium]